MDLLLKARTHRLHDRHLDDAGNMHVRIGAKGAYFHLPRASLDRQFLRVQMKVTPRGPAPKACVSRLYYRTESMKGFDHSHCLVLDVPDFDEFHTYTFQCIPFQQHRITGLRFHPVNVEADVTLRDVRLCDYEPLGASDQPKSEGALEPVFLSYYSRTGSTLAMKVLTRHPEITGHTAGTYDANIIKYFTKLYFMFGRSHIPHGRAHRNVMLDRYSRYIRHYQPEFALPMPFEFNRDMHLEPFRQHYSRFLSNYLPQLLSDIGAPHLDTAKVYVEKQMDAGALLQSMLELFSRARVLAAFRDPRDVLLSLGAFEKQKQTLVKHTAIRKRIDEIMSHFARRLDMIDADPTRAILFRYEDLLTQPTETIGSIVRFLGLDDAPDLIDHMAQALDRRDLQADRHMTATDVTQTIGRWRQQLSPRWVRAFHPYRRTFERLGYEV